MSMMAQTIKVETTRLEKGEVAIIDNIAREILVEERLIHYVVFSTGDLPAGATNVAMNILNLRAEANELYNVDRLGIDGGAWVRLEYPSGATRNTPHQLALVYDQVLCPKAPGNVISGLVNFWLVPDRYPTLRLTNRLAVDIDTVVYFFGWKYRTKIITADAVEAKRAMGIRVLEAESFYATA